MSEKEELEGKIYTIVGHEFNIQSARQLSKVLYEEMKLPVLDKTNAGNPSTSEDTLRKLSADYELASLILNYRRAIREQDSAAPVKQRPGMPQARSVLNAQISAPAATTEIPVELTQPTRSVISVARPLDDSGDEDILGSDVANDKNDSDNQSHAIESEDSKIEQIEESTYSGGSSGFSLSPEQQVSYETKKRIKEAENERENGKFSVEDAPSAENEFSKASAVMNNRKKEESDDLEEAKSKAGIIIVTLMVLLGAVLIALFANGFSHV